MRQIIAIILLTPLSLNAQQTDTLDINNIKATINFNGPLFNNTSNNTSGFEAPKGSGKTPIYASGIWIAGENPSGQAAVASQMWYSDYHGIDNFRRVWKVNKSEIDYHMNNYSSGGYNMPVSISSWPAHGDTTIGQDYYMAPFEDVDQNGYYTPSGGDYPAIKGDQAIWWVMYDDSTHVNSGGDSLNIELQCMAYAYDCSDSALNNTIFVDFRILNKSNITYTNMWVGNWIDFDVGCAQDDFVGSNVEHGFFYGYNADSYDGDEGCNGALGYGSHTPVQAAMIFGAHQDDDGIDNPGPSVNNNYNVSVQTAINQLGIPYSGLGSNYGDGQIDNERLGLTHFCYYNLLGPSWTGGPVTDVDYYNYLKGYFRDGTHWHYGGNGHISDPTTTNYETNYFFPSNSDQQYWSTDGNSVPTWNEFDWLGYSNTEGDRRGLGSSGPFAMTPGEIEEVTFAYVFAMDNNDTTILGAMDELEARCEYIKGFVDQGLSCGQPVGIDEETLLNEMVSVYPNPTSDQFTIQTNQRFDNVSIYDHTGKLIRSIANPVLDTQIDLSGYANGLYIIHLNTGDQIITKKLVKS